MTLDMTRARVRAAADRLCRYPFACWHYGDSIGFEGLLAATDVLGDDRYEGFVHGAVKSWIPRAKPYREIDNTAPGYAMYFGAGTNSNPRSSATWRQRSRVSSQIS